MNKIIVTLTLTFLLSGCFSNHILEYDYISNFEVVPMIENNIEYIRISGLCGESAYGIKHIVTNKKGNTLQINIKLKLRGCGNFDEKIKIDKDIDFVVLGKKETLIWSRNDKSVFIQYPDKK